MSIGERIKELREQRNWSQNDLAIKIGITQDSVSLWENNRRIPNTSYIISLCDLFEISTDYLLCRENDYNTETKYNFPTKIPNKAIAFVNEYGELFDDNNFRNITKLYQAAPKELRAVALGYLIGLFQSNGVNTKKILGY